MATRELDQSFLEIGRHCSEDSCRQLDFLPFVCSTCHLPFCSTHWRPPLGHSCPSYDPSKFDNRVPSCPLCSLPISLPLDSSSNDPNISMDQHLELECVILHPELKKRKDENECMVGKCKTKLVVLGVRCDKCRGKFCTKHRYERDHGCEERIRIEKEEEEGRKKSAREGKGKGFGGFFNNNNKSTGSGSQSRTTTAPSSSRDRLDGLGQSGLAALRRAQQQARTSLLNATTSSSSTSASSTNPTSTKKQPSNSQLTIEDSSDSSIEIISSKPPQRPPHSSSSSHPPPITKPSTSSTLTTKEQKKPPPKIATKRATAEQVSQRKALEVRYRKGLLSESEKIKYAELRAREAQSGRDPVGGGGKKEVCTVQ